MKDAVRSEYVGGSPEAEGNYIAFDLTTAEQFVAKVFRGPAGQLQVLSGHDHQVHDLADIDTPSVRWIRIEPMNRIEMDRYLEVPTT